MHVSNNHVRLLTVIALAGVLVVLVAKADRLFATPAQDPQPLGPAVSPTPAPHLRARPVTITRRVPLPSLRQNPQLSALTTDWSELMREGFEGPFPGDGWLAFDVDGPTNGEYLWAPSRCRSYAGARSAWAIGGADGATLRCGAVYPNNLETWMVYGPVDLSQVTDARLEYELWLRTEYAYDGLYTLISNDGENWLGFGVTGSTEGWLHQELYINDVGQPGNYVGHASVYFAFVFASDASNVLAEGAYVDDVVLWARSGGLVTALSSNFDDGRAEGWTPVEGSWTATSRAYCASGIDARSIAGDPAWTDYVYTGRFAFNPANAREVTLLFRVEDAYPGENNGHYFQIANYAGYNWYWGDTVVLHQVSSGYIWRLAANNWYLSTDAWHRFRLEVFGAQVKYYIGGALVLSYAGASAYPRGRVGVKVYRSVGCFDDLMAQLPQLSNGRPNPRLASDLRLSATEVRPGQPVTATFAVHNYGDSVWHASLLGVGGRGPGGDQDIQDFPFDADVILPAGQTYLFQASRSFSSEGLYRFQAVYRDVSGAWHSLAGDPGVFPTATLQVRSPIQDGPTPTGSPPSTPQPTDEAFHGVDSLPGYKGHDDGPVVIETSITRYYGPAPNGVLAPAYLGRSVAPQAQLTIMAYDVDCDCDCGFGCLLDPKSERDHVYVNGTSVGYLCGANGEWRPVTLSFDTSLLRFPELSTGDGAPDTTHSGNTITISIDDGQHGWATHIAWARLTVPGVRPILLVRGFDLTGYFPLLRPIFGPPGNTWDYWKEWGYTRPPEPDDVNFAQYRALAEHYAPIWYQAVDPGYVKGDFIVRFNYDGDWRGNNNWDNLGDDANSVPAGVDLSAWVYYSVVESESHWFITYADFHPRDRKLIGGHENDMEGVVLVVRKPASGRGFGNLELMLTQAHGPMHLYRGSDISTFNGHPEVFVEARGHGVYSWVGRENQWRADRDIRYEPGSRAGTPALHANGQTVSYALTPLDDLWRRQLEEYGRTVYTFDGFGRFDGDGLLADRANPPWGWEDETATGLEVESETQAEQPTGPLDDPQHFDLDRGAVLLCPAQFLREKGQLPDAPFSLGYIYNPYVPPGGRTPTINCTHQPALPGYLRDQVRAPNVRDEQETPGSDGFNEQSSDARVGVKGTESVYQNAEVIRQAIDRITRRYGVNKVNLVGHSKGGLDIRASLTAEPPVDTVVTLATPHEGTLDVLLNLLHSRIQLCIDLPWLDLCKDFDVGLGDTVWEFSAEGTEELERRRPEPNIGQRGRVRFVALAGTDCHYKPFLESISCRWGLPNDGLVSRDSAHALKRDPDSPNPYRAWFTHELPLHHTTDRTDPSVFEEVSRYLIPPAMGGIADREQAGARPSQVTPAAPEGQLQMVAGLARVIGAGETHTQTLTLDGRLALVSLTWSGAEAVTMTLTSPLGERLDPASLPVTVTLMTDTANRYLTYVIADPPAGGWLAEITAGDVLTGTEAAYFLEAIVDSDVVLEARVDTNHHPLGTPIGVYATLTDAGVPVTGAAVTATVSTGATVLAHLTLHDDGAHGDGTAGDGLYGNRFEGAERPGIYTFRVEAHGQSGGQPFARLDFAQAAVGSDAARLADQYAEGTDDTDGDGLFNILVITVGTTLARDGRYELSGRLTDRAGKVIAWASAEIAGTPGTWQIPLAFDGESIALSGLDGPYELRDLYLTDTSTALPMTADVRHLAYVTRPYTASQFQRDPILIGAPMDQGVDQDGDSRYELLRVTVPVNVVHAGAYRVSARLVNLDGQAVTDVSTTAKLAAGLNSVALDFDGRRISASGLDGPYQVWDFIITSSQAPHHAITIVNLHTTQVYDHEDFEAMHRLHLPLIRRGTQ